MNLGFALRQDFIAESFSWLADLKTSYKSISFCKKIRLKGTGLGEKGKKKESERKTLFLVIEKYLKGLKVIGRVIQIYKHILRQREGQADIQTDRQKEKRSK